MSRRARRIHRGGVLVEVLLSLAIATVFLSAILPEASRALTRADSARRHNDAVRLASNVLEQASAEFGSATGSKSGREDALEWTLDLLPEEHGGPSSYAGRTFLATYRVTVREPGGASPIISLTFKRLRSGR